MLKKLISCFCSFSRLTTPSYIHKELTPPNRPGIDIKIKKDKNELQTAVYIGDLLSLEIKGPGLYLHFIFLHCFGGGLDCKPSGVTIVSLVSLVKIYKNKKEHYYAENGSIRIDVKYQQLDTIAM